MSDALRGEWLKAWTGKAWLVLMLCGVYMSLMASFGYGSEGSKAIDHGTATVASVTDDVVRAWMMTFLFASLYGAVVVTREYSSGSISRSVLVTGRSRLFGAKLAVGTVMGGVFGLLAVVCSVLSAWGVMATFGRDFTWTKETTLIALGVFVCNVLAAPWGVFLGWIIRHQIAAVVAVMALTLLMDPGIQRLAPEAASYLFTIAMSSIYRDVGHVLLSPQVALLVIAGWLAAAGFAAYRFFRVRDLT
ncbi:ABC transporter permease [Streptomyces sp. OfavH-34-F]|uniref:ABC transporter permease n=1 Tax=Streptomyces sp. OfavH-34-F TaxID=2917760 RepID=UPI001EF2ECC3|nr:ABC transporter permease [Streptomyces sp. OfavH-34-F]MCG7528885.1 ABC transporter permease [Streptomyces sp. OfavH-34-F]